MRSRRRKRRDISGALAVALVLAMFAELTFLVYKNVVAEKEAKVNEFEIYEEYGVYKKKIDYIENDFEEKPSGEISYDTYIPRLSESIQADIAYMRMHKIEEVEYYLPRLSENNEKIYDTKFILTAHGGIKLSNFLNEKLTEISIYKDSSTNYIYIYGKNDSQEFCKIVFNEKESSPTEYIVENNIHVPNDIMELNKGIRFERFSMEYGVLFLGKESTEQTNKKLYLYMNKEKVAEVDCDIQEVYWFLKDETESTDGKIYYIFTNPFAEKPWIKVVEPFKNMGGEIISTSLYNEELDKNFPILKADDGRYYSIVPNNKEDFVNYRLKAYSDILLKEENEVDTSFKVICLNDELIQIQFKDPVRNDYEIDVDYDWKAYAYFGSDLSICFRVDGLDTKMYSALSEDEVNSLRKTVFTVEEFWEHIEKMRETYAKYYSYKE